jgi:hypothetical protein
VIIGIIIKKYYYRQHCTGVISLGLDHVDLLGDTVEKTAWHKGGIFNADAAAWTVEQPGDALRFCLSAQRRALFSRSLILIKALRYCPLDLQATTRRPTLNLLLL